MVKFDPVDLIMMVIWGLILAGGINLMISNINMVTDQQEQYKLWAQAGIMFAALGGGFVVYYLQQVFGK